MHNTVYSLIRCCIFLDYLGAVECSTLPVCVELTIIVISRQVIVFFVYIVTVVILKLLKYRWEIQSLGSQRVLQLLMLAC